MKASFAAQLQKVSSKVDRSYSLTFVTRELKGPDAALLFGHLMTEGWVVYSPKDDITEADIPSETPDPALGTKTASRRLRDRMFVFYNSMGRNKAEFNQWYESELERIGERYLEKVDE